MAQVKIGSREGGLRSLAAAALLVFWWLSSDVGGQESRPAGSDIEETISNAEQAEVAGDTTIAAKHWNQAAQQAQLLDRFETALEHLERADRLMSAALATDRRWFNAFLTNRIGFISAATALGRYEQSADLSAEAMAIIERVRPAASVATLKFWRSRVDVLGRARDDAGALVVARRMMDECRTESTLPNLERVLCELAFGRLLGRIGQHEEALTTLDRVAAGLQREHEAAFGSPAGPNRDNALRGLIPLLAGCEHAMAVSCHESGSTSDAEAHLRAAIRLWSEAGDREAMQRLAALESDLGLVVERRGDAKAALELQESALARTAPHLPDRHAVRMMHARRRAMLLAVVGRIDEADRELGRLVALAREERSNGLDGFLASRARFLIQFRPERTPEAIELLDECVARLEDVWRSNRALDSDDRAAHFERLKFHDPYDLLIHALCTAGSGARAFDVIERSRARTMAELCAAAGFDALAEARRRAAVIQDLDAVAKLDDVAGRASAMQSRMQSLAAEGRILQERGDSDADRRARGSAIAIEIAGLRQSARELRRERAHLTVETTQDVEPRRWQDIKTRLRRNEALLTYHLSNHSAWALLLTENGERCQTWRLVWRDGRNADAASIEVAVNSAIKILRSGDGKGVRGIDDAEADTRPAGAARVLDDLATMLLPEALLHQLTPLRRVYVATHGALHGLPLEALPVQSTTIAGSEPWLLHLPPVVHVASGTVFAQLRDRLSVRPREPRRIRVLAVGVPHFEAASGLKGLPGAQREVEAIAAAFRDHGTPTLDRPAPEVRVLSGADAELDRIEREAPGFSQIHFATHGIAEDALSGVTTALVFSKAPSGRTLLTLDRLLADWRVYLTRCELVVLSACSTQVGRARRDDSPIALPFGFHFAGCPTVISTLWPLEDDRTATLMSDFYCRLAASPDLDVDYAFLEARRAAWRRGDPPAVWAPFTLHGVVPAAR